ncbi:MAG TPA: NAD(P)/FAD-dependent oxidoreductase [Lacipirellulaceae bacterium]|nr:NAD(P)/FAD-dependent oxidoreductase [Lacipirellulaceae bacterium]
MCNHVTKKRILILGGGFGGVATARHLERLFRRLPEVETVLVSRENFVLMTPLLFEVFSGILDLRSCSVPVRGFLRGARFVEAAVQSIDLDQRVVQLSFAGKTSELAYDQLVIALGSKTNREVIDGSQHAFTFKTLADALLLRNHVIECFERADVETDPQRKAELLTFVIIGGGLVGVELLGELTAFVDGIVPLYKHVDRGEVRFILLQAVDRIMPEIDPALAAYGSEVLAARRGVEFRTNTPVRAIEPRTVHLANETIAADTIILAAGVAPNPMLARLPVAKDKRGCIVVEPTMRCLGYADVWVLGDCASIPGPDGKPYPPLAQHALREAKVLAENIHCVLTDRPPQPYVHESLGMMGSLGHYMGFAQFLKLRMYGFPAWFIRRTYYLLQMPGWSRRLRMMIDWTFGLLFQPDIVKVGLDSETASMLRLAGLASAGGGEAERGDGLAAPVGHLAPA